jgi:hypothetical protein
VDYGNDVAVGCGNDVKHGLCEARTESETLESWISRLFLSISSPLLKISLYSLSSRSSTACFLDNNHFMLSRSISEALAAARISLDDFFLLSLILSFLFNTSIYESIAKLRSLPLGSLLVLHSLMCSW